MLLLTLLVVTLVSVTADESVIPTKTEYERYLDQVLLVFKNDDKIKSVLMGASSADIKNGIVERTLSRLHPDIRTKLDEVKRSIISEYKQKLKKAKLDDTIPKELYKFSDDDLKHLLKERQERLQSMDETRRKQFHKYELEKELKHKMMLRAMNEYDRKVQEALDKENVDKKKENQKKLAHPGNKKSMEEAWVNDGFDKESFNPKTFFKLHDLNGDNEWDPFELEAVFEREVEALFEGLNDIDEREKSEEVSRMREHVVKHLDTNEDGMVQLSEFLAFAKGKEFDHEDPWDTVFMETIPDSEVDDFEAKLDAEEKAHLEKEAMEDKAQREAKIKQYEEESLKNQEMLKEHSQQLREAILAANKAKELAQATKLVGEAALKKKADEAAAHQHIADAAQAVADQVKKV